MSGFWMQRRRLSTVRYAHPSQFCTTVPMSLGKDHSFSTSCLSSSFPFPLLRFALCPRAAGRGAAPLSCPPSPAVLIRPLPAALGQPSPSEPLEPRGTPTSRSPASTTASFHTQKTASRICPWKSWILLLCFRKVSWGFLPHF